MTRELWRRVKAITGAALEQSEAGRGAYAAAACGGDGCSKRKFVRC
jgi:hypothetical protein